MIELTDKAYEKLLEKTRGDEGITIALLPGGCAGFEYKLDYIGTVSYTHLALPTKA